MSYPYPQNYGGYRPPQQTGYQQPGYQQPGHQQPGHPQQTGYQQPAQPSYNPPPPGVDPNVHQWFLSVDADRSGRISAIELKQALIHGNWATFTEEACRMMIGMFDKERSGAIDVMGFQALWTYIQQWKAVFERYDADRSGQIEANELQRAISEMGYRISPQFFTSIIGKYDPKRRRSLGLDDFIVFCVQLQLYTNAFRERDASRTGTITLPYEDFLNIVFLAKP